MNLTLETMLEILIFWASAVVARQSYGIRG